MIGKMRLSDLQTLMPATLFGDDAEFTGVTTDSRAVEPGDLFIALKGENFDANSFVADVAKKQAVAAVVSEYQLVDIPQLLVSDTTEALGWLGHINRKRSDAIVIGITGSQGKTTVKEITGTILRQTNSVVVTRGNFNNNIGAPLTLLSINETHQRAVIELGANALDEIAWTAMLTDPQIVLLNNAAETHLEGFGSLEGVVQAKGEIIDSGESTHTVVLNADDPHVDIWRMRAGGRRCVAFSLQQNKSGVEYFARDLNINPDGSRFTLVTPKGQVDCFLPLPGSHNVANALAAAALCIESGEHPDTVSSGLLTVKPVPGRLCPLAGISGSRLLDDSYNASPSSFRAAIDVLVAISKASRLKSVLIAGDMAELGTQTESVHSEIGSYAKEQGVDELWTVGEFSALASHSFGGAATHFADKSALQAFAVKTLDDRCVALIKGSRSAGMDSITKKLSGEEKI